MARRLKAETYRRLTLGDLRHLGRVRYGTPLPDDDAGRDHIEAQLRHCSDLLEMRFEVSKYAPWFGEEAGNLIARIRSMPRPLMSMRQIGEEFRVTNEERNRHKLWRIRPVDMTDEQLAEQRKAKHRERMRRLRKTQQCEAREAWLAAHSISRAKPWEQLGMSRRQWYYKGKPQPLCTGPGAGLCTGPSTTNSISPLDTPVQSGTRGTPTKLNGEPSSLPLKGSVGSQPKQSVTEALERLRASRKEQ